MNLPSESSKNLSRMPSTAEASLLVLLVMVCVYFSLSLLFLIFSNYWPGPIVDYWIDIPNVEKFFGGELTLHALISAHANVHRLLIPRLLFIADYRFFSGSNVLLVWVSIFCKVATLLLFNHIIKDQSRPIKFVLNALAFAAILNTGNISNIIHNSNMQWDLVSIFCCFSIYFYSQNINAIAAKRATSMAVAVLFFVCGFFSQAGALPLLFVFIFISAINKKWLEVVFGILFAALVLYLTFAILPVNEPENPTYQTAAAMMVFKLKYVAIYVFKMFSGGTYFLDNHFFAFSWWMLALLIISLYFSKKTKDIYNNIFLSIALFSFLMMITIAAARVDFAFKTWPANRYQTNTLFFILSLSVHSFFSVSVWFGSKYKKLLQSLILALGFSYFLISQYYLTSYASIFSNKIFNAQAYMLTHGVNQYNGADLLPSIQQFDRIAEPDPFFRQHGFAYYTNKQGGDTAYKELKQIGENMITNKDAALFAQTCSSNPELIQYKSDSFGSGYEFSTPLNTEQHSFLSSALSRNTYYTLDDQGVVIGFSFLFIDPDHPYSRAEIKGYSTSMAAKYIAEINNAHQLHCLYSLDQPAK